MPLAEINDWLSEFACENRVWFLKRLAANDTLATKSHQAGPYIPKALLCEIYPSLDDAGQSNPDVWLQAYVDSHCDHKEVRAVWYNKKLVKEGTRNEARITNWGGASSAVLDPESTGALAIFAFEVRHDQTPADLHVWVCNNLLEEDLIEDRFGQVEPGRYLIWRPASMPRPFSSEKKLDRPCHLSKDEMPQSWRESFPSGLEIVQKVLERRPLPGLDADKRLLGRRECEFEMFRSIESVLEGERIARGFGSVDEFVAFAQRVLQRRKSRSGRSLELHLREIFIEEGLVEGRDFSHQPQSDPGKRPDFLFPSEEAYKSSSFDSSRLRLLAAKTTCKDRWRQVTQEANRIPVKHLITLQEGVSEAQFAEMKDCGVQLVVPRSLLERYPKSFRNELLPLDGFIESVRHLRLAGR